MAKTSVNFKVLKENNLTGINAGDVVFTEANIYLGITDTRKVKYSGVTVPNYIASQILPAEPATKNKGDIYFQDGTGDLYVCLDGVNYTKVSGDGQSLNIDIPAGFENSDFANPESITGNRKRRIIIAVAGQSNAVGYDESIITQANLNLKSSRLKMLGTQLSNNLQIVDLEPCADNWQDMSSLGNDNNIGGARGTKGIHLPLASNLLAKTDANTEIVIVTSAYGDTGFSQGSQGTYDSANMRPNYIGNNNNRSGHKWSNTSAYYLALKDRIKFLLDKNSTDENYYYVFGGVVWCQGESDSDGNSWPSNPNAGTAPNDANARSTKDGFTRLVSQLEGDLSAYNAQSLFGTFGKKAWFVYETSNYWYQDTNLGEWNQKIWNFYRDFLGGSHYVKLEMVDSNTNATNGSGKTSSNRKSHIGNDAFTREIAPELARRIMVATNKVKSTYSNPTPLTYDTTKLKPLTFTDNDMYMQKDGGRTGGITNGVVHCNHIGGQGFEPIVSATLYFDPKYKVVVFTPVRLGFWSVIASQDDRKQGDFALASCCYTQKSLQSKISNFQVTQNKPADGADNFANAFLNLDKVVIIKWDAGERLMIYRVRGNQVKLITNFDRAGFLQGGGGNTTINTASTFKNGIIVGVGGGDRLASWDSVSGQALYFKNPIGIQDPTGLIATFTNWNTVTNNDVLNIANKYDEYLATLEV